MPEASPQQWAEFLKQRPHSHFLQTAEWGDLKSAFGWDAVRLIYRELGAQVLLRRLPFGLTVGYVPRPDFGAGTSDMVEGLLREVDILCRSRHAIFCKIEPDAWTSGDLPSSPGPLRIGAGEHFGRPSLHNIQPRSTIVVDLKPPDRGILERMKPKCRYNIGLAQKKDVKIHAWDDLAAFHEMARVTGNRDGFGVHSEAYYRRAFELFHAAGMGELLVATYNDQPLAALMVIARGRRAWYLYGASTDAERNRMPNYLLQWEAMRWAKQRACEEYDLWGVPDENESTLEADFEKRHDGLWGVYRFKRGFGGEIRRAAVGEDRVYSPFLYQIYMRRVSMSEGV